MKFNHLKTTLHEALGITEEELKKRIGEALPFFYSIIESNSKSQKLEKYYNLAKENPELAGFVMLVMSEAGNAIMSNMGKPEIPASNGTVH